MCYEFIKFIRRNTRTSYKIKSIQREEISEYPVGALREAIINAVMHRDYWEKVDPNVNKGIKE